MFEDIGAEVNELFSEYNYSKELKVSTKNESGYVVTGTGNLASSGPKLNVEAGMDDKSDANSLFKLNKVGIDSDGKVTGELTMRTSDKTKLYINAEDERQEPGRPIKSFGSIGANYSTSAFTLDTNVDIVNGPTSHSSCFYHNKHWNIKVGSEIQINTHFDDKRSGDGKENGPDVELENFNLGFAFHAKKYIISARTNDRMGSVSFGYHHQVTPKVAVGTIVNYGLTSNAQNLCMGAKVELDGNNTFKLKVNSAADLSGLLKHKLNAWSTLHMCAKVNLHQNVSTHQKFGIGLTFDAGKAS